MEKLALLGGAAVRVRGWPEWPVRGEAEEEAVVRVVRSGKWGKLDGEEVRTFERRFAEYCGARHGIACVNGTVTLRIALLAAGIKAGDEVVVPPYTFLATATAVVEANAVPAFADIDRATFNLDVKSLKKTINPRTKAIIPVHCGGLPCDMDAIMEVAREHNLVVIEDAAHAHGSEYKGRRVGGIGDVGSFSFQSSKNLNSGEGGILVTNDDELAERCRSIHNCGRISGGAWYEHHVISANYRLGEFQGAILNAQLDRLEGQTETRDRNGLYLDERLSKVPGVTVQRRDGACTRSGYHLYLFRLDEKVWGVPKGRVIEALNAEGVPVSGGYAIPLYQQPLFRNRAFGPYEGAMGVDYGKVRLPEVEAICGKEGAWIYQSVLLGDRGDMEDIVRAFEKVYGCRGDLAGAGLGGGEVRGGV